VGAGNSVKTGRVKQLAIEFCSFRELLLDDCLGGVLGVSTEIDTILGYVREKLQGIAASQNSEEGFL